MADRWTRRRFLGASVSVSALLAGRDLCAGPLSPLLATDSSGTATADKLTRLVRQAPVARYWTSAARAESRDQCLACHQPSDLPEKTEYEHKEPVVRCLLCAQNCRIADGERGRCRGRYNDGGTLKSLVYGRPISVHVDPIEKKPFYHFLPGSKAFSLSTSGCPLHCKFCQNWEISQARPEDFNVAFVSPERVALTAVSRQAPVIAFTYNEPTVFTEYLTDIARVARKKGERSVLVSCGFMNEEPLAEMCQVLDAIKIDLKGFSEEFYRRVCSAELAPVLRSIRQVAASGVHLEIVNLVVPTLNDSTEMLTELVKWVVGEVGPDVPVHFTRFHPDYQLPHLPPTPVSTLEQAWAIARKHGMRYPYVGNVPGHVGNNTLCPKCGKTVIERKGFFVTGNHVKDGKCEHCSASIAGVWK